MQRESAPRAHMQRESAPRDYMQREPTPRDHMQREPAPRDHMQREPCTGWPRHGAVLTPRAHPRPVCKIIHKYIYSPTSVRVHRRLALLTRALPTGWQASFTAQTSDNSTQTATLASGWAANLTSQGSWPDINYTNECPGDWLAFTHVRRAATIAQASVLGCGVT